MIPAIENNIEQVYNFIESYNNAQLDIKQRGEVFTPLEIVKQMLTELDTIYLVEYGMSIFSNPDLKWYDSSAGIGNFMVSIFDRLDNNLRDLFPDRGDRVRHIIENMLYMSEISRQNVDICKSIFNPEQRYCANIFEQDSLDSNQTGYDIIIGNPPYQKANKKNNNLYFEFIQKKY